MVRTAYANSVFKNPRSVHSSMPHTFLVCVEQEDGPQGATYHIICQFITRYHIWLFKCRSPSEIDEFMVHIHDSKISQNKSGRKSIAKTTFIGCDFGLANQRANTAS